MLKDSGSPIHKMTMLKMQGFTESADKSAGKQRIQTTTIDDGRPYQINYHQPCIWQFFLEAIEGERPPITISIIP